MDKKKKNNLVQKNKEELLAALENLQENKGTPKTKDVLIIMGVMVVLIFVAVFVANKYDLKTPLQKEAEMTVESIPAVQREPYSIQLVRDEDFYDNGALVHDGIVYIKLNTFWLDDSSFVGELLDNTNKSFNYTTDKTTVTNGYWHFMSGGCKYYKHKTDDKLILVDVNNKDFPKKYTVMVNEDFFDYYQKGLTFPNFVSLAETERATIMVHQDITGPDDNFISLTKEELLYLSENTIKKQTEIGTTDRFVTIQSLLQIRLPSGLLTEWHILLNKNSQKVFWYINHDGKNYEALVFVDGDNEDMNQKIKDYFFPEWTHGITY